MGIVYDVDLTLELPRAESAGTAMNALAHCVEALYAGRARGRAARGAAGSTGGSRGCSRTGTTARRGRASSPRRADAGHALAEHGSTSAHAMAQAAGGTYGLPHGAMNALCLPPAMRFNAEAVPNAMTAVRSSGVEQLARLGGFERLRDFGIPEDELDELGEKAAERPGAKANPRPASAARCAELYRSIW